VNIHPGPQVGFEHVFSVFEQSKTAHAFDCMAVAIGPMQILTAESYIKNSQFTSFVKNHALVHTVRLQARINTLYESSNSFNVNVRM
jgi:hypothetical protein